MARAPDARADQAKELYLSGRKLIEISELLNIPEGTVRSWKNRYQWDNATLQKKKCNVAKRKGGQPGNQNAAGHGGTGPPGNKNALRTGEFEALFFDTLEADERILIGAMPADKEQLLLQEIQLLTVRERRMLKRIEDLKQSGKEQQMEKPAGMTAVKYKSGTEKDKWTDLTEYTGVLGQIQSVEDALTRVQARKQKAIDSLHRYGFDDARLEIELVKLELSSLKLGSQDAETADDGFLDALNAEAGSLWGDGDTDGH